MNGEKKAIDIYKFVLKEINGWSQKEVDELTFGDIEGDPLLEGINKILENDK